MGTCYWLGNDSGNEGKLNVAANWSPAAVPGAADDVIFDGRSTEDADDDLDVWAALDLGSLTVRPSFTKNIGEYSVGVSYAPLIMSTAAGTVQISGSGVYRIQCGKGVADCAIHEMIINSVGSVYLSSQKNALAGNISKFTTVKVFRGTIIVHGDSEKGGADGHGGESGTSIGTLYSAQYSSPYTIRVGDLCKDLKNATEMDLIVNGGVVTLHTALDSVEQYGGTINYGSADIDIVVDDDDIASLFISGGVFNWKPQAAGILTATPVITTMLISGGTFDARNVLETQTADPKITTVDQFSGIVDLRSIYANFDITNYNWEGGTLRFSPGQEISFEGGV